MNTHTGSAAWNNADHACKHCGMHHGGNCHRIKAIEYHPGGSVKRIEYWGRHETIQQAAATPSVAAGSIKDH